MVSRAGGPLSPLLAAIPAWVATFLLTPGVRRFTLARGLLDIPNERSSHTVPTPRGGGLAIVVVVLASVGSLGLAGYLPGATTAALMGGALVAAVGWLDDRHGVRAAVRLGAHAIAAIWALCWLKGLPVLTVGQGTVGLGPFGTVLAAVAIVWAINLTNFMDGIDGLAAAEAGTVALIGAALLAPANPPLAGAAAVTGGAVLGFLPWNWQRARIFLGDAGSGFLGYSLATLALASERTGGLPLLVWLILFAVFAVDGSATVLRRAARGERWYAAHRSHAYQRAVQAGWSHARVTLTVLLLNVCLGLLAFAAAARPQRIGVALLGALAICGAAYVGAERLLPMGQSRAPHVDKASG